MGKERLAPQHVTVVCVSKIFSSSSMLIVGDHPEGYRHKRPESEDATITHYVADHGGVSIAFSVLEVDNEQYHISGVSHDDNSGGLVIHGKLTKGDKPFVYTFHTAIPFRKRLKVETLRKRLLAKSR